MLEVLDTAGQEEYTALRDQWIRDGEGFVLVYSISSRSSFSRIKRFHQQIYRVKESTGHNPQYPGSPVGPSGRTINVPIMLVGNKCDRVTEREVSTQEGSALARELGCEFVEASAKNRTNVEKAFYDVVKIIRRQNAAAFAPNGGGPGQPTAPHRAVVTPSPRTGGTGEGETRSASYYERLDQPLRFRLPCLLNHGKKYKSYRRGREHDTRGRGNKKELDVQDTTPSGIFLFGNFSRFCHEFLLALGTS